MKIYCNTFTLEQRSPKTVYVSQYSSYKLGIKATKSGISQAVKLYDGEVEIQADASQFNGYTAFSMTSGTQGRKDYVVKADGVEIPLVVVTTDSTVAELNDKDTVYDLPIASATRLGGVKINGNNLTIADDGTLIAKTPIDRMIVLKTAYLESPVRVYKKNGSDSDPSTYVDIYTKGPDAYYLIPASEFESFKYDSYLLLLTIDKLSEFWYIDKDSKRYVNSYGAGTEASFGMEFGGLKGYRLYIPNGVQYVFINGDD